MLAGSPDARASFEPNSALDAVTFAVPEAAALAGVTPEARGKDKLFYIDLSIDGGESFDNSAAAALQLKL